MGQGKTLLASVILAGIHLSTTALLSLLLFIPALPRGAWWRRVGYQDRYQPADGG
jgi:hypothetical protein